MIKDREYRLTKIQLPMGPPSLEAPVYSRFPTKPWVKPEVAKPEDDDEDEEEEEELEEAEEETEIDAAEVVGDAVKKVNKKKKLSRKQKKARGRKADVVAGGIWSYFFKSSN